MSKIKIDNLADLAGPLKELQDVTKKIANPLDKLNMAANIGLIMGSPMLLGYAVVFLVTLGLCIYLALTFFKNNRFRTISWGVFSKLIPLNKHIEKFNKQIYEDFRNIHQYVSNKEYKLTRNLIYFHDTKGIMVKIKNFMDNFKDPSTDEIQYKKFSNYIKDFFKPNPSFKIDDSINKKKKKDLEEIFTILYKKSFHNEYSYWINYDSIWNFVRNDEENIHNVMLGSNTNENEDIDKVIQLLKSNKNVDFESLRKLATVIKTEITMQLLDMFPDLTDEEKHKISMMLFKKSRTKNLNSISDYLKDQCSLMDNASRNKLENSMKRNGLSADKLNKINDIISFIDVMTHMANYDYNVNMKNIFDNVTNNPLIHSELSKALKVPRSHKKERSMIIYNACYQLFNELLYMKIEKDGVTKFFFHKNSTNVNENKVNQLSIWKSCQLFFNIHMINMFSNEIDEAIKFKKNENNTSDKITLYMESHVSIARLQYLIRDYFVVINEYNDKSNPDKQDIKDFWEKRVNSFGFKITKNNRPRDIPKEDYSKPKKKRQRSDNIFDEDFDHILRRNTPWELYKEYTRSLFIKLKHPDIPFFQSIIATIRYIIPEPGTVLNNFLDQLKGNTPRIKRNKVKYDFSMKYKYNSGIIDSVENFQRENFKSLEEMAGEGSDVANRNLESHDEEGIAKSVDKTVEKNQKEGNSGKNTLNDGTDESKGATKKNNRYKQDAKKKNIPDPMGENDIPGSVDGSTKISVPKDDPAEMAKKALKAVGKGAKKVFTTVKSGAKKAVKSVAKAFKKF